MVRRELSRDGARGKVGCGNSASGRGGLGREEERGPVGAINGFLFRSGE
jgi:hypothetical protein